jgi:hypothetical protein
MLNNEKVNNMKGIQVENNFPRRTVAVIKRPPSPAPYRKLETGLVSSSQEILSHQLKDFREIRERGIFLFLKYC